MLTEISWTVAGSRPALGMAVNRSVASTRPPFPSLRAVEDRIARAEITTAADGVSTASPTALIASLALAGTPVTMQNPLEL
jgi:hypothetical protein